MTYDESAVRITIDTLNELRMFVKQNETDEIRRRRYVREALRALDVRPTKSQLIGRGNLYRVLRLDFQCQG